MPLERTIRWRPLEGVGLEHLCLTETAGAIRARSTLIGERNGLQYGASYEVLLEANWVFRSIRLERADGAVLTLNSDGQGHWTDGSGLALPALDGCIDIDLSGSPFTNSLPIRRVDLHPGRPTRFRMAWIPLDTLAPFADEQIYTRLDGGTYRYQSGDGAFEAELTVDADGLVIYYPTLFTRI